MSVTPILWHCRLPAAATLSAIYFQQREALTDRDRAILDFAEALTATPPAADESHVRALRDAGLDDAAIVDLVHAIAIFGWANRLMHPLGQSTSRP